MSQAAEKKRQGREAIDGARKVERVTVCLETSDREKLQRLGGSVFVRRKIREEAEPSENSLAQRVSQV